MIACGPERREQPQPRLPGMPLQCGKCPKQSPSNAKRLKLSPKNWRTLKLWREAKATFGRCLTRRMARDAIIRRNFAELDAIHAQVGRAEQAAQFSLLTMRS
ncbi:hypothetical protein M4951_14620 [Blastopirellula sp. J2-11]|uniref:hypothetical protein n=1 Tax=Blastopirellula sp. J2-11 TaxID=2943192 RepID=UPI0021C82F45|nr:hypothetical protein [Blastopirellula sp. J2-11]UUO04624.1 hypothetical protein M4951_14620 [Blastopirellula sp. J2-11]